MARGGPSSEGSEPNSADSFDLQTEKEAYLRQTGVLSRVEGTVPEYEDIQKKAPELFKSSDGEARKSLLMFANGKSDEELETVQQVLNSKLDADKNVITGGGVDPKDVTPKQIEAFMIIAAEFRKKFEEAERKAKELFKNTKILEHIARRSPKLKQFTDVVGTETLRGIWEKRLTRLALRDEGTYTKVISAIGDFAKADSDWNALIERRSETIGLSGGEGKDAYENALISRSVEERRQALQNIMSTRFTGFNAYKRFFSRLGGELQNTNQDRRFGKGDWQGQVSAQMLAEKGHEELEGMLKETRGYINTITEVLGGLDSSAMAGEVRAALVTHLRNNT
jgi:hypothetical protein